MTKFLIMLLLALVAVAVPLPAQSQSAGQLTGKYASSPDWGLAAAYAF